MRHRPSGEELRARPEAGESVEAIKQGLIAQFEHKFHPPQDFEKGHYQIGRDGKRGGSWGVRHLPTGIVLSANTFDNPETLRKSPMARLLREVVAEIWRRKSERD